MDQVASSGAGGAAYEGGQEMESDLVQEGPSWRGGEGVVKIRNEGSVECFPGAWSRGTATPRQFQSGSMEGERTCTVWHALHSVFSSTCKGPYVALAAASPW